MYHRVATVEELEQMYMLCPYEVKDAYLVQILREFLKENKNSLIIVFSHTCKYVRRRHCLSIAIT